MKGFFKYLLASILGVFISGIILLLIFFGAIGGMISSFSSSDQAVNVSSNSVLHMPLNQIISDRSSQNPFKNFYWQGMEPQAELGLDDILKNLEKAKTDDNIEGIYLDFSAIPAGVATIEEIRNALMDFKKSGKFIIAYSDTYTQKSYYLATTADKVYLNPEGNVTFVGLRSEVMFYKDALKKIGVEPQIIRHGKFKAAVEPFMLDKMSNANREQVSTFMGSIWDQILIGISNSRNIEIKELNRLADEMVLKNAEACLEHNLVDGLKYKDEILNEIRELSGRKLSQKIKSVSMEDYTKVPAKRKGKGLAKDKIAVIYAMGGVIMGEGEEGTIGSDRISRAIRKARKDSTIKAIVFRINSGGGSALASEVIWREINLAKEVKPVIASLGDVAASGGYYIACPAHKIVASPNTITGSIGVFGMMPNAKELFNDKLGINIDVVKTNDHSDMGSIYRPLTAEEKQVIQFAIEDIYDVFIDHVAEGRGMTKEEVDAIGQGRVWSGTNALEIGLIDEFGGLELAIEMAAEEAGLERYRTVSLPKLKDPIQQIMEDLSGNLEASVLERNFGENARHIKKIKEIQNMKGIQARIPYEIEIY